jgi:hypothetical protein
MALTVSLKPIAMLLTVIACGVAAPGLAETQRDVTPPPLLPLPPPPLPEPIPMPPPSLSQAPLLEGAIGIVEMDAAGNIHLHLRRPTQPPRTPDWGIGIQWLASQDWLGYGEIEIDHLNPHYQEMLQHLAGLEPGQTKTVPPWRASEEWHCAFDPFRGPCPMQHLLPNPIALR